MLLFIFLTLQFAFRTSDLCFGAEIGKLGKVIDVIDGVFQYEVGAGPLLKLNSHTTDLILRKPVTLALVAKEKSEAMPNWKNKSVTPTSRFLKILLEDVWQEYQITHRYNFTVPKINVKCEFDCENIDRCKNIYSQLSNSFGNCGTEYKQCYTKSSTGYTCKSCSGTSCTEKHNSGSVCCVFSLSPDRENTYYAFHFEVPKTYYVLSWTVCDKDSRTIVQKKIRLESPTIETSISELESSIKVESFPTVSTLHSKWGFAHRKDLRLIKTRMTMNNAQYNGNYHPNLNELGWYQLDYDDRTIHLNPQFLKSTFDITVRNFDAKDYTWHFNALGCENDDCSNIDGDILLEKYSSEIAKAELFLDKNVIVRFRQNPQLKVTLNLGLKYEDVLSERDFHFETFTATLTATENENVASVLNIAVVDGYGRMTVTINSTDNFFETQTILIPSLVRKRFETKIILSKKLKTNAWVCLTIPAKPEKRDCFNVSHETTTPYQETTTTPMRPRTTTIVKDPNLDYFIYDTTQTMSTIVKAIVVIGCVLVTLIIIGVILWAKKYPPLVKCFTNIERRISTSWLLSQNDTSN